MLLLLLTVDGLLVPRRRLPAFVDGFNRVVPGFVFPGKKLKLRCLQVRLEAAQLELMLLVSLISQCKATEGQE
jgi:hypothetical protein